MLKRLINLSKKKANRISLSRMFQIITKTKNRSGKNYNSEEALEKVRETTEAYTIAYIWKKAGKPVAVNTHAFKSFGRLGAVYSLHFPRRREFSKD